MKRIYTLLTAAFFVFSLCVCLETVPASGAVNGINIILNDGFDDAFTYWKNSSAASLDTTIYHTESPSLKIAAETYVYQEVSVLPDTEYTFSYWAYPAALPEGSENTSMGFKFEYYDEANVHIALDDVGKFLVPAEKLQTWSLYETSFVTPKDCTRVNVLLRLYNKKSVVYFDDVTLTQKAEPNRLTIEYADVFNYTDEASGKMLIRLNREEGFAPSENAYLMVTVADEEDTVYESARITPLEEPMEHIFSTEEMEYVPGETKVYTLTATLYDNGKTYSQSRNIYKYPRPSMLDKDGNAYALTKDEDGNVISRDPFDPMLAYHVDIYSRPEYGSEPDVDDMPKIGVNVVQCMYSTASGAKAYLDEADKHGQKVLVPLYAGMLPAGHPLNVQNTKDVVLAVRDHPALFGYILMDEPYGQAHRPGSYLEKGYTIIRALDTEHIITFMNDKPARNRESAQYCDVLMIDPYIWKKENAAAYVGERTAEAVQCGKPVYSVLQVSVLDAKVPSFAEVRSMWYQAVLAGAKGTGYYAIYDYKWEIEEVNEEEVKKRISLVTVPEMWNPLCDFSAEIQTVKEMLLDSGRNNVSDETDSVGVRKITWESGAEKYMVLLNTNGRGMKTDETDESLTEALGEMTAVAEISLENGSPALLAGDTSDCSVSGGKLTVDMEYCGVYVFRLSDAGITRDGFLLKALSPGEAAVQSRTAKNMAVAIYTDGTDRSKQLQNILFSQGAVQALSFNIPNAATEVKVFLWENDFIEMLCGEKCLTLS